MAMTEFVYTNAAQRVIFGCDALDQLNEAVKEFGWQRLMLCTIPRFKRSGLVVRLENILGHHLVATYSQVEPHVQQEQVEAATKLAGENQVEAVIGLGGGSPIGFAKAVSQALERQHVGKPHTTVSPIAQPFFPVVAITTTYSGSELTPIYGVTQADQGKRLKITVTNMRVSPKLVIYDPQLTLALPPQMTASSGINALAHCIEAVYSITRNPLATAAALHGIRHITRSLRRAVAHGDDLEARTELMLGAHLAATAVTTAKIGLHHGLCHILGGSAGIPHGIANGIMLPHAMRFNADTTTRELAAVAQEMGIESGDDEQMAARGINVVNALIKEIGLPQRLRDVGVAKAELPQLARAALKSTAVQNNPKPVSVTEVETIFRAAW